MLLLIAIGVFSMVFGILFLFFPRVISKMVEWSNRMITRTDDLIIARKKAVGIFLILAGVFILASVLLQ